MYSWQLLLIPDSPHSWTLITIKPTVHNTKRMKAPMMTSPGKSCRCEMSQSMIRMKRTETEPTEIQ